MARRLAGPEGSDLVQSTWPVEASHTTTWWPPQAAIFVPSGPIASPVTIQAAIPWSVRRLVPVATSQTPMLQLGTEGESS